MGALVTSSIDYFGRIPHNRIVTGLLYVIVRNSTGKDDFLDAVYENWDDDVPGNLQASPPFKGVEPTDPAGGSGAGQSRTNRKKSIGDYDVTCFHVTTAGCLGAAIPVTGGSEATYWTSVALTNAGYDSTSGSTWADSWIHPLCQSFVRYTLLSRHNNSYGNDDAYWDYGPVGAEYAGMERTRYFYDDNPSGSNDAVALVRPASPQTAAEYLTGSETKDWGEIDDGEEAEEDVTVTGAVLGDFAIASMSVDTQALQLSASVTDTDTVTVVLANHTGSEVDIGDGTLRVAVIRYALTTTGSSLDHLLGTDSMINTGKFSAGSGTYQSFGTNLGTVSNNTWVSPVKDIEIFGGHDFNATENAQNNGGSLTAIYSSPSHNVTSYDLVVRLTLFAYTDTNTYVDFENRVNIFYQPFGETGQVSFKSSSHTE